MKALLLLLATGLPAAAEITAVAHPEEKFPAESTAVWTPLFQATWDKLGKYHGGKPERVEPPNPLISRLDSFRWDSPTVMPDSGWQTWAGPATEEFLEQVNREAGTSLGNEEAPFHLRNRALGAVAAFGILDREVSFPEAFFRSTKLPLRFAAEGEAREVRFFGVKGEKSADFTGTVKVLAYRPSEKSHALQLPCRGTDETIVLFRPPAAQDFATACLWLREWRKEWRERPETALEYNDVRLHRLDVVKVPYLKLETVKDFAGELGSMRFYKGEEVPRRIVRAEQKVEFELHERGARVRAEVSIEDAFGDEPEPPPVYPRIFSYDAPFFVFLWRERAEWPYFGAWIGNADAMQAWE